MIRKGYRYLLTAVIAASAAALLTFAARNDFGLGRNMEITVNMMRELSLGYVDPVDPDKLMEGAAEGMVSDLDPYTEFIPEDQMSNFELLTTGKYGGVGSLIRKKGDWVTIAQPYKGSPADRAGLKIGDKILAIDGKDAKGFTTEQVSSRLKGEPGSKVKVTVEHLDGSTETVTLQRERISLGLKQTTEDPWLKLVESYPVGSIVDGKVTKIVQFGVFISVEDGIEGLVHISELANRHVENPETVVKPGEEVFVKVIDVDLDRRRISLSLKQANDSVDPASEDFDPALYGMPAEYDEQGNYKYPEGFDPNTNEWIAGYEKQREEWESQYAAAHELWEEHKAFVAKELENAAASAAEDGQAPKEEKVEETSNYSSDNSSTGTLADSDQLAALRDQLLGK